MAWRGTGSRKRSLSGILFSAQIGLAPTNLWTPAAARFCFPVLMPAAAMSGRSSSAGPIRRTGLQHAGFRCFGQCYPGRQHVAEPSASAEQIFRLLPGGGFMVQYEPTARCAGRRPSRLHLHLAYGSGQLYVSLQSAFLRRHQRQHRQPLQCHRPRLGESPASTQPTASRFGSRRGRPIRRKLYTGELTMCR